MDTGRCRQPPPLARHLKLQGYQSSKPAAGDVGIAAVSKWVPEDPEGHQDCPLKCCRGVEVASVAARRATEVVVRRASDVVARRASELVSRRATLVDLLMAWRLVRSSLLEALRLPCTCSLLEALRLLCTRLVRNTLLEALRLPCRT